VVEASTPGGPLRILATLDSLQVAGRWFFLVGGGSAEPDALPWSGDEQLQVTLVTRPGNEPAGVVHVSSVPFLGAAGITGQARYLVSRDAAPLLGLQRQLDRWFLGLAGATMLLALLAGTILARRVSRPVEALAAAAAHLPVDEANTGFDTDRPDELGDLARVLDAMVGRLRAGTDALLLAERHAATGDLARQVNHDIKNGLVPIRNVLRHLSEVAARQPAELAGIFREREGTLAASISYLEELSKRYATLVPAVATGRSDANAVIRQVVEAGTAPGVRVDWRLAGDPPLVRADEVVLRRIIENLVRNAEEALQGKGGTLTLTSTAADPAGRVRIEIRDTGPGMTRGELDRAFQEYQSSKPDGTGLGLPVVRQLVTALGGAIRVETAPGAGTTCILEIPAA
jgi:signal transduction histidine kinase